MARRPNERLSKNPSRFRSLERLRKFSDRREVYVLGELTMSGEVKGRMGFVQGEKILHQLLVKTGLIEIEHTGNSYYYARK